MRRGDRVRVWLAAPAPPTWNVGQPIEGRLIGIGGRSLAVRTGDGPFRIARGDVSRIDRSVGRPHAWRNAGYAFLGTAAVGSVINLTQSRSCVFTPQNCFLMGTVVLVLPASGLAALVGGLSSHEAFEPARLPPP